VNLTRACHRQAKVPLVNLTRATNVAKVPLVIIALVAVIGFLTAVCDDGDGGGGGNVGPAFVGSELKIVDQQVYTEDYDYETYAVSYSKYTGSKTLDSSSTYGGTGSITNGKFNFTLGVPDDAYLQSSSVIKSFFEEDYDNVVISKEVNLFSIEEFEFTDGSELSRGYSSINISDNSTSMTSDSVMYVYVDTDVTFVLVRVVCGRILNYMFIVILSDQFDYF